MDVGDTVDYSKLGYDTGPSLNFISADCTGQGYADWNGPYGVASAITQQESGRILLYPISSVSSTGITFNSFLRSPSGGQDAVCTVASFISSGFPVTAPAIDITGQFTPPFTLQ